MRSGPAQQALGIAQAAKGLAILMVVLEHVNGALAILPGYALYIGVRESFIHLTMPVFFFLLGASSPRDDQDREKLVPLLRSIARFIHLYIVWSLIYATIKYSYLVIQGGIDLHVLKNLVIDIVAPRNNLWFIYVYVAIQILRLVLAGFSQQLQIAVALIVSSTGMLAAHKLRADTAHFIIFVVWGSLFGRQLINGAIKAPLPVVLTSLTAFLLGYRLSGEVDVAFAGFVNIVLDCIGIVLAIGIWAIPASSLVSSPFKFLGKISLEIYLIHSVLILPLYVLLPTLLGWFGLFAMQWIAPWVLSFLIILLSLLFSQLVGRSSFLFKAPKFVVQIANNVGQKLSTMTILRPAG